MIAETLNLAAHYVRRGNPERAKEALHRALGAANRAKRPDVAGKVLAALQHVRRMPPCSTR